MCQPDPELGNFESERRFSLVVRVIPLTKGQTQVQLSEASSQSLRAFFFFNTYNNIIFAHPS